MDSTGFSSLSGSQPPELLVEPSCARIVRTNRANRLGKAGWGLGEMTNEEVGGMNRYRVGVDAEEHVIGALDPLHLAA